MNGNRIEVYISLNPNFDKNGHKRPASLCERLLGIVPGPLSSHCPAEAGKRHHITPEEVTRTGTPVAVRGIVPDSSALRCRRIKPGQVLLTVNDCRVDVGSLDTVLTELLTTRRSNKVKLTLTTPHQHEACLPVLRRRDAVSGHLLSRLPHNYTPLHQPQGGAIMYLTLGTESGEDGSSKEDIVYQFPKSSNEVEAIRGALITLAHTLTNVADTPAKTSSLLIGSRPIQVCYHVEGRNLLVLSTPDQRETSGSLSSLEFIVHDVVRLLRLQFMTIDQAFTSQHHTKLDHLFTLLFHRQATVTSPFLSSLSCVQALNLSSNNKGIVDTELSNFEAADFAEKSEDACGLRRTFATLGTCIFYKGYLLGSHLPSADLTDVYLFLSYHGLVPPTPGGPARPPTPLKQLVVWQEVFPTRRCQDVPRKHVFGYSEPDGRWFLLVVGMSHTVLCVLLESGGCTTRLTSSPGPDCVYVEQAKACLLQLMSSHLVQACDTSIESGQLATVSADMLLTCKQNQLSERNTWGGFLPSYPSHSGDSPLRFRTNSLDKPSTPVSPRSPFRRTFSLGSRTQLPASITVEIDKTSVEDRDQVEFGFKRSAGSPLFQYVFVETAEGVVVSPCTTLQGPIQAGLMENFQRACLSIRALFSQSKRVQKVLDEGQTQRFGVDVTFDMVEEHGTLFQYDQSKSSKKSHSPLMYWVVGRLFRRPSRRELYVCFHESTPPNLVELAFRLSWGRTVT